MSLIVWGLILIGLVVLIIIIRNKMKKEDYVGNSLDLRLSNVRASFSDVCKKFVNKLFGC